MKKIDLTLTIKVETFEDLKSNNFVCKLLQSYRNEMETIGVDFQIDGSPNEHYDSIENFMTEKGLNSSK